MKITSAADFVEAVIQIWPPYRWDEVQEQAWTELMVRELSGFKPIVLERGFQEMVRRRKESKIPTPAECIAACTEAKRWVDMEQESNKLPEFRTPQGEFSTERWRLAHELKRTPLGRQAAQDGWIVSFVHFCRRNQRLPAGAEIDQCKRDSEGIEEICARAMRGDAGSLSAAIAKWGAGVLEKRRRWADEALRHG